LNARELVDKYDLDLASAESMIEHNKIPESNPIKLEVLDTAVAVYGTTISTIALIISVLIFIKISGGDKS